MGIGKRIKEARENLGLTQKELADKLGITGSAITNYENNTSHPKEPIMYKLFEVLHCDANFLFQDEMKKSPAPKEAGDNDIFADELMNNYKALNREGQRKLVDYSKDLVSGGRYAALNEDAV